MSIVRAVPDIASTNLAASRVFYTELLGFNVVMDLGCVMTLASPDAPKIQINLVEPVGGEPTPQVSVEVTDVRAVYEEALRRSADIVYPLTAEHWGVLRFFVRDPNGTVVNVLSHQPPEAGE